VAVVAVAFCASAESFTGAVLSYLVAGLVWAAHYRARTPPSYSKRGGRIGLGPPAGISGNFLALLLLWPVHAAVVVWIYWERLNAENRFLVVYGPDRTRRFGTCAQALDFAANEAQALNRPTSIHDQAHQSRDEFGNLGGAINWVLPSGNTKRTLSPEEALQSLETWGKS
jgi:hypothetical protein